MKYSLPSSCLRESPFPPRAHGAFHLLVSYDNQCFLPGTVLIGVNLLTSLSELVEFQVWIFIHLCVPNTKHRCSRHSLHVC